MEVKEHGKPNDLLQRLAADESFAGIDLDQIMNLGQFVGRAPQQVDEFIAQVVEPIRGRYSESLETDAEVGI